MMLVERSFHTGELELNYAEGPNNGPPLLLLHGFTSRWQFYLPIILYLESRYHIYAPDLRGHGKSGRTPGKYNYNYDYIDLQCFLDNNIETPAIIMGHSRGGVQGAMLASRNHEKIKALVILDSPLFMTEASKRNTGWWDAYHAVTQMKGSLMEKVEAFKRREVQIGDTYFIVSDVIDELGIIDRVSCLSMVDPNVLETKVASLLDDNAAEEYQGWYRPETALPEIKCPVLIVQSGEDVALTDENLHRVMDLIEDAVCIKLYDFKHSLGIEEWNVGELMRAISPFLESNR